MENDSIATRQLWLIKALLAKIGGDVEITKDEFNAAQDNRLQILQFEGKINLSLYLLTGNKQ